MSFSLSFGEPVLAADPMALFGWSGTRRLDAVLDVKTGTVDIAMYILDDEAGDDHDLR